MIVLFLTFLCVLPSSAATFNFTDAVVDIFQLTNDSLLYSGATDKCKRLIIRDSLLHHLSTNGVYQSWRIGQFNPYFSVKNITASGISEFGISPSGLTAIFSYSQLSGPKIAVTQFNADLSEASTAIFSFTESVPLGTIIATDGITFNGYSKQLVVNSYYALEKLNKTNLAQIKATNIPKAYSKLIFSPDYQTAIVWTSQTKLMSLRGSDYLALYSYFPAVLPTYDATSKITFSDDSSLVIVETDQFNPLVVLNVTELQPVAEISINQSIKEAHFLDSTNSVVVVLGTQSTIFVDLLNNNSQYEIPLINGVDFAIDRNGNFFSCFQNSISQQSTKFTRVTSINQQQIFPQKDQQQFFASYNLSDSELNAMKVLNDSQSALLLPLKLIYNIITQTPFAIFFLQFINYFSLGSIYILLNFPIPEHVYKCLTFTYQQINIDTLRLLGIDLHLPMISAEKVDSRRALFFQISSDVLSSNSQGFAFLVFNLFAIILLQKFCNVVLRKENIIRQLMNEEKAEMICGQIINMLTPLTLPWIFLFLKGGMIDVGTKINSACYSFLFFFCFVFPILYLLRLLARKQQKEQHSKITKSDPSKHCKKSVPGTTNQKKVKFGWMGRPLQFPSKKLRRNNSLKKSQSSQAEKIAHGFTIKNRNKSCKKPGKKSIINISFINNQKNRLSLLLTAQTMELWYLCQANCLLPALVLFPEPAYFLVPILLFLAIGVAISLKKKKHRLNSFVMSLYPFLFHLSFMIFYWCSVVEILVITEIFCLTLYFLGSLHQFLFMLYQIIRFFCLIVKDVCFSSKITPLQPQSQELDNKKQSQIIEIAKKPEKIDKNIHISKSLTGRIKKAAKLKNPLKINYKISPK